MAFALGDTREPDKMTISKWMNAQPLFDYSSSEITLKVSSLCERVICAVQDTSHVLSHHPTVRTINKMVTKQIRGML